MSVKRTGYGKSTLTRLGALYKIELRPHLWPWPDPPSTVPFNAPPTRAAGIDWTAGTVLYSPILQFSFTWTLHEMMHLILGAESCRECELLVLMPAELAIAEHITQGWLPCRRGRVLESILYAQEDTLVAWEDGNESYLAGLPNDQRTVAWAAGLARACRAGIITSDGAPTGKRLSPDESLALFDGD